jgi:hypothetical protein
LPRHLDALTALRARASSAVATRGDVARVLDDLLLQGASGALLCVRELRWRSWLAFATTTTRTWRV